MYLSAQACPEKGRVVQTKTYLNDNNIVMEPHRHIVHIRNTHIGFNMNAKLCEPLCIYLPRPALRKEGWFKKNIS